MGLPGLGDDVNRSTSLGFLSMTATKDGVSESANASAIQLSPSAMWPWACPNLEEFCLTHKCMDGCPCPMIIGNVCDEVKRRNTGVTCNYLGCSWSGVSNAYCGGEDSFYACCNGVCP